MRIYNLEKLYTQSNSFYAYKNIQLHIYEEKTLNYIIKTLNTKKNINNKFLTLENI